MTEPKWVSDEAVLGVHQKQVAEHGGLGIIRDQGLLESALTRPLHLYHYADPKPSIFEVAAAYAYGITCNHPFSDGNKRTALVVCRIFLRRNGADLQASATDKYETIIKLAKGELTEKELAVWLEAHS